MLNCSRAARIMEVLNETVQKLKLVFGAVDMKAYSIAFVQRRTFGMKDGEFEDSPAVDVYCTIVVSWVDIGVIGMEDVSSVDIGVSRMKSRSEYGLRTFIEHQNVKEREQCDLVGE
ncbi:hypothetical protein QQ045_007138 [Rhodiola kirilowii]